MNRRHFLFAGTSLTLLAACADDAPPPTATAAAAPQVRHLVALPQDADPLHNEMTKYPSCTYCGMDRNKYPHSRHLVHYDDNAVDPTCSIHCAAVSLSLHLDRGPKAIYAADFGATVAPKPLVNVDVATYLIGSTLPGTMTARSKMAFASLDAAGVAKTTNGGALATFDDALAAAYADTAKDTKAIRRRRAERRAKAAQEKK